MIAETGESKAIDSAGPLTAPIQRISKLDMQIALQHTHIVAEDASQTLCGLLAAYGGANDTEIEVKSGLKEGEEVAIDPIAAEEQVKNKKQFGLF